MVARRRTDIGRRPQREQRRSGSRYRRCALWCEAGVRPPLPRCDVHVMVARWFGDPVRCGSGRRIPRVSAQGVASAVSQRRAPSRHARSPRVQERLGACRRLIVRFRRPRCRVFVVENSAARRESAAHRLGALRRPAWRRPVAGRPHDRQLRRARKHATLAHRARRCGPSDSHQGRNEPVACGERGWHHRRVRVESRWSDRVSGE